MRTHTPTALIATAQPDWRRRCAGCLLDHGCDVHTASNGSRGLDLLRKHIYDIIVVDDSFTDIRPLEFSLTAQDLAPNVPITLVAGERLSKYQPILDRRDVFYSGPPDSVLERLESAVRAATHRHRPLHASARSEC
jgi:CheY-like chemotaxis protein